MRYVFDYMCICVHTQTHTHNAYYILIHLGYSGNVHLSKKELKCKYKGPHGKESKVRITQIIGKRKKNSY